MKHAALALLCATLATTATAQTDCAVIDEVAATSYQRANEALAKRWQEAAKSAAYFFWYVHDLSKCNLTKTMGTYMTQAGLGKGTQPVGPADWASKLTVSIPSGSNYAAASVSPAQEGVFAPEALVVNGATYKLWTTSSAAVSKSAIEELLVNTNRTKLNGIAVDKELLQQWKTVPTSPALRLVPQ